MNLSRARAAGLALRIVAALGLLVGTGGWPSAAALAAPPSAIQEEQEETPPAQEEPAQQEEQAEEEEQQEETPEETPEEAQEEGEVSQEEPGEEPEGEQAESEGQEGEASQQEEQPPAEGGEAAPPEEQPVEAPAAVEEPEAIEDTAPVGGESAEAPAPPAEETPVEDLGDLETVEDIAPVEGEGVAAPAPPDEEAPVEDLGDLEDVEETPAPPVEESPAPPTEATGEKKAEEEKPAEEAKKEEEKKEGFWFWNEKINVRGLAMARAIYAPGLATPFSGGTLMAEPSPFVRYPNDDMEAGATFFDIPHIGVLVTADFTPDYRAHLHMGYNPRIPSEENYNKHYDDTGKLNVFEAYFRARIHSDYFKQPFHVRAGRIAPWRLSAEHKSPMRTSRFFVTPSPVSTFLNNIYGVGADISFGFEPGKNPIGGWAVGILEGNYFYTLPLSEIAVKHYWPVTDTMSAPGGDNSKIRGRPGAYAFFTVREGSGRYRASGAYYWNGVSGSDDHGHTLRVATGSLEANWKRVYMMYQNMNAETVFRTPVAVTNPAVPSGTLDVPILKFDGYYFLMTVPLAEKHRASVRYDEFSMRYKHPLIIAGTSKMWALNYTFKFKKRHTFALEHVILDTIEWSLGYPGDPLAVPPIPVLPQTDADDDFTALNYTFTF